jgi:hypothetical protein
VRSHQHELVRLHAEQARGGQVHLGRRLVDVRELRREQAVEAQITVASEVDEHGHMAVRERCGHVPGAQRVEPRPDVGPGLQPMPRVHEARSRIEREVQVTIAEERVERREMELVEIPPWPRAVVHLVEDRSVPGAPVVGQLLRVARHPARA